MQHLDTLLSVMRKIDVTQSGLTRVCMMAQASRCCRRAAQALLANGEFRKTVRRHRQLKLGMRDLIAAPASVLQRVQFLRAVDSDGTTNVGRMVRLARLCDEDVDFQYWTTNMLWMSCDPRRCQTGSLVHSETCETAGREGAFDVLSHMLRAHPLEVKLLVTVCWALALLVECLESNRARFLQTDGLERLLALEHEWRCPGGLSVFAEVDNSNDDMYTEDIQACLTRPVLMVSIRRVCNTLTSQTRAPGDTVVWHGAAADRVAAARRRSHVISVF